MMSKPEILARINEIINDEKGRAVTMDSMFIDAELDSLGSVITLITIDSEFHIFEYDDPEKDLSELDLKTLAIRDLVVKCILSITNTSLEQKSEKST